ncbi:hypothetical protein [Rhodohalobacter sulfatireducens]|uniref:Uncharacterized protein n=1 Tax=Rhodohalobacter sulfatireducens TaxID=2911366 RepID=A0ABS9KBX8_9BACT|nr:hypothetical protein [Rhodohalobacter sulfatireducens]MCG2588357.1 hypothetical protein [Rhodohalobacter sulfatireducens]
MKQKKTYRCSVISVGQVLKALSKKIEKENLNFHIQSFSNLENPEIVATIRTDEKNEFTGNSSLKEKSYDSKQDVASLTQTIAKKYKLEVQEVEATSQLNLEEISTENYPRWIAVYSTFNNPFTWLNIGYFKESLRNEFAGLPSSQKSCFLDFCDAKANEFPSLKIPESKYVQLLIGIQPISVSVE